MNHQFPPDAPKKVTSLLWPGCSNNWVPLRQSLPTVAAQQRNAQVQPKGNPPHLSAIKKGACHWHTFPILFSTSGPFLTELECQKVARAVLTGNQRTSLLSANTHLSRGFLVEQHAGKQSGLSRRPRKEGRQRANTSNFRRKYVCCRLVRIRKNQSCRNLTQAAQARQAAAYKSCKTAHHDPKAWLRAGRRVAHATTDYYVLLVHPNQPRSCHRCRLRRNRPRRLQPQISPGFGH